MNISNGRKRRLRFVYESSRCIWKRLWKVTLTGYSFIITINLTFNCCIRCFSIIFISCYNRRGTKPVIKFYSIIDRSSYKPIIVSFFYHQHRSGWYSFTHFCLLFIFLLCWSSIYKRINWTYKCFFFLCWIPVCNKRTFCFLVCFIYFIFTICLISFLLFFISIKRVYVVYRNNLIFITV